MSAYEKLKDLCPLPAQMWRSWLALEKESSSEAGNYQEMYIKATTDCYGITSNIYFYNNYVN